MRIIQSYWACNKTDLLSNQPSWLAPEYNLMSWALSCLQLKKYYNNVSLYCDKETKRILIDELKLPYAEVSCELDTLNSYHSELWAIPKIYVYGKQTEPFLHVDGDVFIWKAFDSQLFHNGLIAQNLERATYHYDGIMAELEKKFTYFPEEILNERKTKNLILAYNAGIFGGKDFDFFKEYSKKAFEFVERNIQELSNIKIHNFNIFFEQYLFYCLAKKHNKPVDVLIDEVFGDNDYKGFGDFMEVPHNKQYLHILGTYKRNEAVCIQLANRLRLDYPGYYYKIIGLYKKNGIPLLHDYYESGEIQVGTDQSLNLKSDYASGKLELQNKKFKSQQEIVQCKMLLNLNDKEVKDLNLFCKKIDIIKSNKFSKICKLFLYGRDLNITPYFEYLFSDVSRIYQKSLIALPYYEIVKSDFDWSKINNSIFYVENESTKSKHTLIIPECDQIGYSLANVDTLDIQIFKILKTQNTIGRLLNACKKMFSKTDLENSKAEFEKLIFGRIKKGIHNKVLKVVS